MWFVLDKEIGDLVIRRIWMSHRQLRGSTGKTSGAIRNSRVWEEKRPGWGTQIEWRLGYAQDSSELVDVARGDGVLVPSARGVAQDRGVRGTGGHGLDGDVGVVEDVVPVDKHSR